MALKVNGTIVVGNDRAISNVTNISATDATFSGTGSIKIPSGTTAERPSDSSPSFRYNSTTNSLEYYNGSNWTAITKTLDVTAGHYFLFT